MLNNILKFMLILFLIILYAQCTKESVGPENDTKVRDLTSLEKQLVDSDNKFGFNLFRKIIETEKDKNVFISPLSVSMALGMTLNGTDGTTKEAMQKTLELLGLTDEEINKSYLSLIELLTKLDSKVKFQIANSIWYRSGVTFEDEFININKQYFKARVEGLNFNDTNAKNIINSWVDENTNGKITKIVNSINPATVMFLINAIYFKGTWTYQFDESMTYDDWFTMPGNSQKMCKMMVQTGDLQYFSNDILQAVNLPYGDGLFSMVVILPKSHIDIDSVITEIDQENWNNWLTQFSKQPVSLIMPRFKLEYKLDLNDVLNALGMGIAFSPGQADFTRMHKNGGLYISKVKHKTYVEVNEEGTEAAAVTSVEIRFDSAGDDMVMHINRPFIFAIRENNSQTILFVGKIVDPT